MNADDEACSSPLPYDVIDAKLSAVIEDAPSDPPWADAWRRLDAESSEEDRLAVHQAVRRAGSVPEAASFYLVSHVVGNITAKDVDDTLRDCASRLQSFERAHGLDDAGFWPSGAGPEGYADLREESQRAWKECFARRLEDYGEADMARLFRQDGTRFENLREEGRQYFFGPQELWELSPEVWLHMLLTAVADSMTADSPMGPLGCRYGEDEGFWQADIYPTPVELVGGAVDGEVVVTGFELDLDALRAAFDRVEETTWRSLGFPYDEGPRVVVSGVFRGREVMLQVLARAPEDEEPGMKLDTVRPKGT